MNKEYQEALNCLRDTKCDEINNCEICSLTSYCGHYQCVKTLQEAIDKANKYDEKEIPKKFEIIDKDLIFHSTPQPTKYYLTIRCSCKAEFDCRAYQHWKVIDKNNVEKDYFEYEYTYCPHCGQRIEE